MMNLLKEEKGQGNIESLLLVGAAILVALTVGIYLKSIAGGAGAHAVNNAIHTTVEEFP